ncbi:MAG: 4-(cytidine 5'-diphospho)-2-C-methyl-D-erythritol kinase [Paludibacteraceae bacterium]|nr:4-(cytidine 5'-diphospho)-2-C-methyl-D-erythritol kinase [Paludibacteraceae bacterium]MBR5971958.1 4-(cytidine 5'-diphospho)-2-C-methyl-D-erythritol kinase [Paludibacteraceae bacterium]
MISFPNAKINIGLNITEKRPDNYHNLESFFYPIPIKDILEIVESSNQETRLHLSGISIDGNSEDNLIMKAYRLLAADYSIPAVDIYLEKKIPFGAGLGGGSSDAAFTLKMLNEMFSLQLSTEALENYASKLGADCPFFIQNKPVFATGIGNIFTQIDFSLNQVFMVLVKPDVHISTKEAYSLIKPQKTTIPVCERIKQPMETWKDTIVNDFEYSVFPQHPSVKAIKDKLYENGAIYASMSGSGSSVYGFFSQPTDLKHLFPSEYVFQGGI